ncbi:MAG: ThuA domain-containing protein [Opitutaceae bacterium]|nr:ThuA domain-containing protein [Opitutaceae bacterium]
MPPHALLRPLTALALALIAAASLAAAAPHRIMLLTGQSNPYHDWAKSAPVVRDILAQTGLFTVDVVTTPPKGADMAGFAPKFAGYAAVVMVYEGAEFPEATKAAFVDYMKKGGGLVVVHDANNAFPFWPEWNEMIGVGGWGFKPDGGIGARTEKWGPKIRWRDGKMVLDSATPGNASHPPRHDFTLVTRAPDHPIMRGLPAAWLHANDEIYSHLRGPAKNVTVLATAQPDKGKFPTSSGEHEPMLMTITYGQGRVFHTTLGHVSPKDTGPHRAIQCAGFIVTLQRGTEWAATGKVMQKVPADFPTAETVSVRAP